jgi:hypothetical protein
VSVREESPEQAAASGDPRAPNRTREAFRSKRDRLESMAQQTSSA